MLLAAHTALATVIEADCRSDWAYAGGAAETVDPVHSVRSGDPKQHSSASVLRELLPGALVTSVSFHYQYNTGFGPSGVGANFTLRIAGTSVYESPELTEFRYSQNRSNYSLPVTVDKAGLVIKVPTTGGPTRLEIDFANNDRNVQLKLPMSFVLTCANGPCASPPLWEPTALLTVYRGGDKDQNGTACPCFRIPALTQIVINGTPRLLAFAEARYHGCRPDVHPSTGVAIRYSLDGLGGKRWSPIHALLPSPGAAERGGGLNYPTPVTDAVTGVVHLFFSEWGIGTRYTRSVDGGQTWTPVVNSTSLGGNFGVHGPRMNAVQLPGGRLVAPCKGNRSKAACFSDDHMRTWQVGADVPHADVAQPLGVASPLDAATPKARDSSSGSDERPVALGGVLVDEETGRHGDAANAPGTTLGGLGETTIAVDGRSPRSLSLFFRAPSSSLVNHAISTSGAQCTRFRSHHHLVARCPRALLLSQICSRLVPSQQMMVARRGQCPSRCQRSSARHAKGVSVAHPRTRARSS